MHCETYVRSRLYFSRYRTLHDLRILATIDPKPTPLADRTPEWFTLKYIEHLTQLEHSKKIRLIFQAKDEDIDPESRDGRLVSGKTRALRHVSRAEVRSLLAMHARWLMKDQKLQKQNKVFDPYVWGSWLPECDKYRAESRKEAFSWGDFYGGENPYEDNEESLESDEDDDHAVVDVQPIKLPRTAPKRRKRRTPQVVESLTSLYT